MNRIKRWLNDLFTPSYGTENMAYAMAYAMV